MIAIFFFYMNYILFIDLNIIHKNFDSKKEIQNFEVVMKTIFECPL